MVRESVESDLSIRYYVKYAKMSEFLSIQQKVSKYGKQIRICTAVLTAQSAM